MEELIDEYDGPWKEALDFLFREFVELCFPVIASEVDWDRGFVVLDSELQKIVPEAELGKGYVDKLVRIWTRDGVEKELLVHVEVQNQRDADFPYRMYRYNHRLEDVHGMMPVSLAVLGDTHVDWRPETYAAGQFDCRVEFRFPVVKLTDYSERDGELESSTNVFAPFVLAHLKTIQTRANLDERLGWKVRIARQLFDRGMDKEQIRRLFRVVDWVMKLPRAWREPYRAKLKLIEQEKHVPFITETEQDILDEGMEKGRQEGRQEGLHSAIEKLLIRRFGADGLALLPRVKAVTQPDTLETIVDTAITAPDLDAIRNLLPPQA